MACPSVGIIADANIAGNAADAGSGPCRVVSILFKVSSLLRRGVFVRRALEDVLRLGEVIGEVRIPFIEQKIGSEIVGIGGPIQPPRGPTSIPSHIVCSAAPVTIGRKTFFIVARVHNAGEHELFGVVHAENALGFFFGFPEGWEEHSCQDRDDGDNHQQFNKGKTALGCLKSIHSVVGLIVGLQ